MNRLLLASLSGLALAVVAHAQTQIWKIDTPNSAVQFAVRHMGISTVRGAFTKFAGSVQYDPGNVSKTALDVTIDAASIDSRVEARDKDLRSPKYFDVQQFPQITFRSKHVEQAGAGRLKVTGDLTMHGVTKQVVLDVEGPSPPMHDAKGTHMGASATTSLNRFDFGIKGGQTVVADAISITLDMELLRPAAAK